MIQADTVALVELSQLRERWAERFSWDALAATGLRVLGALIVGFLAYAVLVLVLRRVERAIGDPTPGVISAQEQRARTLLSLMRSVGLVLIILATIVMMLGALGVNVGPLLAGAGVIGVAVGFGSQTLVRDVITGIFLLLEDAVAVGDVVQLGGLSGVVEHLSIRAIKLRAQDGSVHIIPFSAVTTVTNMTRDFAFAVLDVTVGWHHMTNGTFAADGSRLGSDEGISGLPQFLMQRNAPFHSITDFEQIPDPSVCEPVARTNPDGTTGTTLPCRVNTYLLGGPGLLISGLLDRYQANAVATYLATGLGHHVIKAGADVELTTNLDTRAYTGGVIYNESASGTSFQDFRAFGYLRGPDELVPQNAVVSHTRALAVGGFLQDSWSIPDKVTLNAGLRYDAQTIYGTGGNAAFYLPNQLSPRVGLIYDFTQQGRSKLYANYARYYQNAVLAMFNSQFSNVIRYRTTRRRDATATAPGCDPLRQQAPYTECRDEDNIIPTTGPLDISRKYQQLFAINSPVDSTLVPQSSDEFVVGAEYEVLANTRAGVSFTHRYMNDVIEDMSRNEATNYFIGNPGRGIASDFERARRDYDAVSLQLTRAFSEGWLAQASYTWSSLRGNYSGLFRPESGQLAPNVTSDFDLVSLLENKDGPLPLDRTHRVQVYGSHQFDLTKTLRLNLGLGYQGQSGAPINVQGAHYIYGSGLTFILPRGSGGTLPWVHTVDGRLSADVKLMKDMVATLSVDVFNLFNFQAATRVDEIWTANTVDAVLKEGGATFEDIENGKLLVRGTQTPAVKNPNFGNPIAYQPPRSVRFGMRVAF